MGGTTSTNQVDTVIDVAFQALNRTVHSCSSFATNDMTIDVEHVQGDFDFSHVNVTQFAVVNAKCVGSSENKSKTSTELTQKLTAAASSITGALNLSPGDTSANNIINSTVKLGTTIQNVYYQTLTSTVTNQSKITLKDVHGNVKFNYVNFSQTIKSIEESVMQSSNVQEAKNDLQQMIDAQAHAEKKGLLDFLGNWMALIIILIAVVFIGFFKGVDRVLQPNFILPVVTLVLSYFLIAYMASWPPYKSIGEKDTEKEISNKKSTNRWLFLGFLVAFVVSLLLTIAYYRTKTPSPVPTPS